jgi:hypothetical protein
MSASTPKDTNKETGSQCDEKRASRPGSPSATRLARPLRAGERRLTERRHDEGLLQLRHARCTSPGARVSSQWKSTPGPYHGVMLTRGTGNA